MYRQRGLLFCRVLRILHKKKINCDACYSACTTTEQSDTTYFISQRLYGEGSRLSFPSVSLFKLIETSVKLVSENLERLVFTIPFRKNLAKLLIDLDYGFLPPCHFMTVKFALIFRVVNNLLRKFLKDERHKSILLRKKAVRRYE